MALAPGSVLYYKNDGTSETVSAASQYNFDNDCYIHSVLGVETIGFTRDGYSFVSWNTASDGSGDSYNEGDTYTFSAKSATSSLYAIWEEVLPVSYLTTDTELTSVADAIREKGGTSAALVWPQGYVDAIGAISGGGGGTAATVSVVWPFGPTMPGIVGPTFYYVGSDGTYRSYQCEEMDSPTSLSVLVPSIIAVEGSMLNPRGSIDVYTTPNNYYRLAFVYGDGEISSEAG